MPLISSPATSSIGVISDDERRRQQLRRLLPQGSVVSEAASCKEASALATSRSLSCAVLDLPMRDCDARHLVQAIEGSGSAVVVITAPDRIALAAEALKAGAQDYLLGSQLGAESVRRAVVDAIDGKRRKEALEEAEKRCRDLFEDASVMHVISRAQSDGPVIIDCNDAFLDTLGYSRDEVLEQPLFDFFDRRWLDANEGATRARFLHPDGLLEECELEGRGGRVIHALVRVAPEWAVGTGREQGIRTTLVDITKRVEAEKALEQSEARTRAVLAALSDTLLRIEICNDGLSFSSARDATVLEDESVGPIEYAHRDLPRDVERQFERNLTIATMSHRAASFEYRLDIAGQARTLEARLVPIGACEGLAIIRDLTTQKDLERQLQQSQRLEAVGRLAGGIAHDFNNILTVISGYAELSLSDSCSNENDAESFREILGGSKRASDLTRQLLAFSRKQVLQPRSLDLNKLVFELEKMLRRMIGEDIRISKELGPELGMVKADPGQIEQILMNLAVNARDAMPAGGELSFCTDNCEFHETYVGEETKIPPGSYVRLTVSDNGEGMDEGTRSHIFEPFFTTKDKALGTGLGLATVYGIVKQSGGFIFVYSEPGEGTVFKMYFPRDEAEPTEESVQSVPVNVGGNETILLVEDDARVLAFAATVLEREGYRVIQARNGDEALNLVRSYPEDIHLVATDVVMPGISGRELAASLQPLGRDIKVLYMSGYTDNALGRHALLKPGTRFLEKPYTRQPLLRAVRQALDSGP